MAGGIRQPFLFVPAVECPMLELLVFILEILPGFVIERIFLWLFQSFQGVWNGIVNKLL
jgi:hypothetical protein